MRDALALRQRSRVFLVFSKFDVARLRTASSSTTSRNILMLFEFSTFDLCPQDREYLRSASLSMIPSCFPKRCHLSLLNITKPTRYEAQLGENSGSGAFVGQFSKVILSLNIELYSISYSTVKVLYRYCSCPAAAHDSTVHTVLLRSQG